MSWLKRLNRFQSPGTQATSMTATCLCLTILVLTTVNISNSSASWVLDLPDMFQFQALHPLAHGTKEKEHGYPWLSVSAGSNHLQSLTRISVSGALHQVRHSRACPSNLSKMRRCILAAERQECPADYQQCALVTLIEVAEDLSSVETITIPDTSRKYAGFLAPYQSPNGKPGKACFETTNHGSGPAEPTKKPQSCISSCPRSVCSSEQNSAWNAACSTKTRQKLGVNKRS